MGNQIFPVIMKYEEARKNDIIDIMQGKRLIIFPPTFIVDLELIPVIFEWK